MTTTLLRPLLLFSLFFTTHINAQPPTDIDTAPSWSPDGKKIIFSSAREGNLDIYTMNADGTGLTRLTTGTKSSQYPMFSPGGKQILFVSERDGNPDVFVMDADGQHQRNLTHSEGREDMRPGWFPDGKQIIYVSDREGQTEIFTQRLNDEQPIQLSHDGQLKMNPSVSPDGKKILYEVLSIQERKSMLYVMQADGTGVTKLTDDGSYGSWSTDGGTIVFQSNRDGKMVNNNRNPAPDIYVMNTDGSNPRNITNNDVWDFYCYLSPDGKQVVFTSMRDGNQEVYVQEIGKSTVKRLTTN